jgi:hypothetical protein
MLKVNNKTIPSNKHQNKRHKDSLILTIVKKVKNSMVKLDF